MKLYKEAGIRELTFDPHHMPLMTPPMPWTSVTSGGSLLGTSKSGRVMIIAVNVCVYLDSRFGNFATSLCILNMMLKKLED